MGAVQVAVQVGCRPHAVGPELDAEDNVPSNASSRSEHHDGAAARVLRVLDAFVGAPSLLGLTQLAERAQLPKSTTHRLLATLTREGYVRRVDDRYSLANRAFEVGNSVLSARPNGLREIAMPYLIDLFNQTRQTVHLAILQGTEVLYLEKIFGHSTVRTGTAVGVRRPAHATALGKSMLAFAPSEDILDQVTAAPLARYTSRTPATALELQKQLDEARACGYAVDRGEFTDRLACVAAPILDPQGYAVAAMSMSTTGGPEILRTNTRAVVETASALSRALGSI